MPISPTHSNPDPKAFYETVDREADYACYPRAEAHPFYPLLRNFIARHGLADKSVLEVGCGKGLFQDVASGYVGADIAESLRHYFHKPYHAVAGAHLPFPDDAFDGAFSYATHEHIPELEIALEELLRVLKPGAPCLLAPAFHSRPWFASGLAVRPYDGLSLREKLIKASIPIRDAKPVRYPRVLARQAIHLGLWLVQGRRPQRLRYGRLKPNYKTYWQSDSDACNSIDPFDLIIWLKGRGARLESAPSRVPSILFREEYIEFTKAGQCAAARKEACS
ncbi:MAG: methyltransferase domain-containing protein [Acidobacteriota bacterium]